MNLIELYDRLDFPNGDSGKSFNAIPIPKCSNFRVAIDAEGNPVLLLSVANDVRGVGINNFRLKYLQFEQNVECRITENGKSYFQTFAIITFKSADRTLQEYFLKISETLIRTLSEKPTQQQIINSLNKFVEVFRSLTDTPTNTVHGLWAELFLIENSSNPKMLLNYWHSVPEEKFDFNSGVERVEVKSSSNFERIHTFSSEQLNTPIGTRVLVASIFVRQHSNGRSIQQLADDIGNRIQNDVDLVEKLNNIIFRTLGNSLEQSIKLKFDYNIAKDSLRFYNQQDISKIEEIHIPENVSEVKFKSDLSTLKHIDISSAAIYSMAFDK